MPAKTHSTDPDTLLADLTINAARQHSLTSASVHYQPLPFEVITMDGKNDTVVVNTDMVVDGINVGEFMKTVGERLLILEADFKMHEKYPALKDAYDQYKMLEKLLADDAVGPNKP